MAKSSIYALFKENNWGETRWVLCAPNCSPFGRYTTAGNARKDAKEYQLKIERREDLDSMRLKVMRY